MKKVLKKFGKYLLLDRLAQGGMAEIFRAWRASVDGGGRLLVLKCVQPDFGEDPEFLQMFRSEIRVTMGLSHPNIVQLYDFGEAEGRPFIAMELVDGKNLKQFTQRVFQKGQGMPPEYAAHIIQQVAAGLHYAHTYKDKSTGEALNIVHRDVSPQNLLLSYDGNLKIIDFGIAKAASNHQATRAGVIKGKPSYLSPEQIEGVPLDGRSDIFSLGAVLWETLTGKKLFQGENELSSVRMIEECDRSVKPPSSQNPAVPPELDAIVMKSLARDRERRYRTAEEMQRALHRFIYSFRPDFDPSEFGRYVQGLFKAEMEQEQNAIRALTVEARELLAEGGSASLEETPAAPRAERQPKTFSALLKLEGVEIDKQPEAKPKKPRQLSDFDYSKSGKYSGRKNKGGSAVGKLLLFALLAGVAVYYFPFILAHLGLGGSPQQSTVPARARQPVSASASSAQMPVAGAFARVSMHVYPSGGPVEVLLNGKTVDPGALQVPVGVATKLEIAKQGFRPFEKSITAISAGDSIQIETVLEPDSFGTLSLHTTPTAEARISALGSPGSGLGWVWIRNTPLEQLKLPPGKYRVQLVNQLLGMSKSLEFSVETGKETDQDVNLDVIR